MYSRDFVYDAFLLVLFFWLIKSFLLKINLSKNEKFWIEHSNSFVRNALVLSILAEVTYILLSEIGIFSGVYYLYVNGLLLSSYLMSMAGICYIRHQFGPKDWKYRYGTQMGFMGIMFMILIYVLYAFF